MNHNGMIDTMVIQASQWEQADTGAIQCSAVMGGAV